MPRNASPFHSNSTFPRSTLPSSSVISYFEAVPRAGANVVMFALMSATYLKGEMASTQYEMETVCRGEEKVSHPSIAFLQSSTL